MIVAVKRNNKQKYTIIVAVILVLITLFLIFRNSNGNNEIANEKRIKKEILQVEANEKSNDAKILEKAILSEVEKVVDLVGQEHIRTIKIIDNKIVIVCEKDAVLEALFVRYGAMAMVKKTLNETVLAVDINYILKSRLYEK